MDFQGALDGGHRELGAGHAVGVVDEELGAVGVELFGDGREVAELATGVLAGVGRNRRSATRDDGCL